LEITFDMPITQEGLAEYAAFSHPTHASDCFLSEESTWPLAGEESPGFEKRAAALLAISVSSPSALSAPLHREIPFTPAFLLAAHRRRSGRVAEVCALEQYGMMKARL
jgi:hypothetical protein